MHDPTAVPLVIADDDTPTARLIGRELQAAFRGVELRAAQTLFGAELPGRPLLIVRLCHPEFAWLPSYLADRRIPYAYLLDDNFWELDAEVDPLQSRHFAHPAVRATLDAFVAGARVVIVWTPRMRDYVARRFPDAIVRYVRPGIDLAAWSAAAAPPPPGDALRIGYPTTRRPSVSALCVRIVQGIGERYGDRVRFEFVDWLPNELEGAPNVSLTPRIRDYDRFVAYALSRHWAIGLAPMAGTSFDGYKTDIKYREYGAMRTPGIYGAGPPYDASVTDGVTGLIVPHDATAWIDAISMLIEDPARRARIAEAAHDDVVRTRGLAVTGRAHAEILVS